MNLGPTSKRQEMMLSNESDVLILGGSCGSGKSYMLHLIACKYLDDPYYRATFLRRTTPQLMKSGNLWDKGHKVFGSLPKNSRPRWIKGEKKMAIFPNGAEIEYSHCQHPDDVENFQGAEFAGFFIDEGCQFEWEQISYFFSRMRSDSRHSSRLVISCNPDPDHRIAELIDWYLDEEGFPDKDKIGIERYFLTIEDEFVWGNSKQELIKKYKTEHYTPKPLSFTFIASTIYDNPLCIQQNPGYLSFLEGLKKVEKARLLHGNWKVRPQGANYFKREELKKVSAIPRDAICCRAWDKAGTEPSEINPWPDYSANIKMYKDKDNNLYISGEFHPTNKEADSEIHGRFRYGPGKRDLLVLSQAKYDGVDCKVIMPIDAGQAGQSEFIESAKKLAIEGFIVKKDPVASQKSKLQKFSPFSAAVSNGFVFIVESTFPNKETLDAFYKELEAFDGSPSGKLRKDDWVDATASAYNFLSKETVIPQFSLPSCGVNHNLMNMKRAVA